MKGSEEEYSAEGKTGDKNILRIDAIDDLRKSIYNDGMEVDEDDIDIRGTIGEGAFGWVSRGILLPTGKQVAVKMLKGNLLIGHGSRRE